LIAYNLTQIQFAKRSVLVLKVGNLAQPIRFLLAQSFFEFLVLDSYSDYRLDGFSVVIHCGWDRDFTIMKVVGVKYPCCGIISAEL
jgi:hypothetical protein